MKSHITSGVSARVKRWFNLMNLALFSVMLTGLTMASASSTSSTTLVAQCIPMNDRFVGPLRPLVREIIGGIGGLIPLILSLLIVILVVWGMIKVFRNEEMSGVVKGIIAIPMVLLVGIAVLILVNAAIDIFNGMCSSNPF